MSAMSALMITFFIDEAGESRAKEWADEALRRASDPNEMENARLVLKRFTDRPRTRMDLARQDLRGKSFVNEDLTNADLTDTDLSDAQLMDAQLDGADLQGARLVRADLRYANLTGANLYAADLSFADLCGARLDWVKVDEHTVLWAVKLMGTSISDREKNTARRFGAAVDRDLVPAVNPASQCTCIAYRKDGRLMAAGYKTGLVVLWDPQTGKELRALKGHDGSVNSVTFSPDGSMLASGSYDNTVRIFDPQTGKELRALKGHDGFVFSVTFSPDGNLLASGSDDNTVRIFDPQTGEELGALKGHDGSVNSVTFSPDGNLLASGSDDNTVRFWEVRTGRCLAVLLSMPEGWALFTPDGRYKVSGDIGGALWHTIGLCRFELGELDPFMETPLCLPDDMGILELGKGGHAGPPLY